MLGNLKASATKSNLQQPRRKGDLLKLKYGSPDMNREEMRGNVCDYEDSRKAKSSTSSYEYSAAYHLETHTQTTHNSCPKPRQSQAGKKIKKQT